MFDAVKIITAASSFELRIVNDSGLVEARVARIIDNLSCNASNFYYLHDGT